MAIGMGAKASNNGMAIGTGAFAAGSGDVAVGQGARVEADNGSAFGAGATVDTDDTNSTAVGAGATTTRSNQVMMGTASTTYTMAGIASDARAAMSGQLCDSGGAEMRARVAVGLQFRYVFSRETPAIAWVS